MFVDEVQNMFDTLQLQILGRCYLQAEEWDGCAKTGIYIFFFNPTEDGDGSGHWSKWWNGLC